MRFCFHIQRKPVFAFQVWRLLGVFKQYNDFYPILVSQFILFFFASRSRFRFFRTNGLFTAIRPNIGHLSIFPQPAQVSNPFSRTQLCTGQSLSQNGVFAPSIRQPIQFIISGVIGTPLSFVQSSAVFSRMALSSVSVAILASQVLQSSPQHPIS